jgi:N-acetyl sugar amidotransferase
MNFCNNCFYNNTHPLNLIINEKKICSGCEIHKEKLSINWKKKIQDLKKITTYYKKKNFGRNNCIIPVTGDRDSYYTVYFVKRILKMNPLLVNYNTHYNTEIGIRNLNYLKTIFGCNLIQKTIDPKKVKKITKFTLENYGNIYWHCIAGQTVLPVHLAIDLNIPLIIWGVHQGVDQVGMFSHYDNVEMSRKYRKEHDLFNVEFEDISKKLNLKKEDIQFFKYPSNEKLLKSEVRGIYLNNFIKWDSRKQNEKMIKLFGYKTSKLNRTFDTYQHIGCFHYSNLHDYLKFLKYGYSLVVDHACREIRFRRISKNLGLKIIKKYLNKKPEHLKVFTEWLNIDFKFLNKIFKKFANKNLFKIKKNRIVLKKNIYKVKKLSKIDNKKYKKNLNFINNSSSLKNNNLMNKNNHVLIGRGWVD